MGGNLGFQAGPTPLTRAAKMKQRREVVSGQFETIIGHVCQVVGNYAAKIFVLHLTKESPCA